MRGYINILNIFTTIIVLVSGVAVFLPLPDPLPLPLPLAFPLPFPRTPPILFNSSVFMTVDFVCARTQQPDKRKVKLWTHSTTLLSRSVQDRISSLLLIGSQRLGLVWACQRRVNNPLILFNFNSLFLESKFWQNTQNQMVNMQRFFNEFQRKFAWWLRHYSGIKVCWHLYVFTLIRQIWTILWRMG